MPKKKLTVVAVNALKPPTTGRLEYWDTTVPGLGLRITDKGARSWCVMYRIGGRLRRMTLGRNPGLSLADAREAARDALYEVSKGNDPIRLRDESEAVETGVKAFGSVVDEFIERYAKGPQAEPRNKSWRETKRLLNKEVGRWKKRPIAEISRRDIRRLLDDVVARGAPYTANRLLSALRRLFDWAVDDDILDESPVVRIKRPAQETARDRVLSDSEIVDIWTAWGTQGQPFGPLYKLLLVTAQRRSEVATLRWSDVDFENHIWTLPRQSTKSDRLHEVPLSALALEILKTVPCIKGRDYVFTTRQDRPVTGYGASKKQTVELSGVQSWRLHDLRRTAASGMARLGIAPHIIEKALNHSTGTISGVAAIYNRHGYLDEKRHALDSWGRKLETIISRRPDNVVNLRRRTNG